MIVRIESVTQSVYCKCGTKLTVTGKDVRPAIKEFAKSHIGEGHGPVTAREFMKIKKSQFAISQYNKLTNNGQEELPW